MSGVAKRDMKVAAQVVPHCAENPFSLFGLDVADELRRAWADNDRVEKTAVWSRGKGCEQLIRLIAAASIAVEAVYDRPCEDQAWMGLPLRNEEAFEADAVDGIVVGTLSPGVAEDLQRELVERFPDMPVLSAAPWMSVPAPSPVLVAG